MSLSSHCPVRLWAQKGPEQLALLFEGKRWTYQQLDWEVGNLCEKLVRTGLKAGDRIALLTPNRVECVFLFHAVARLDLTLVPLNSRLTPAELKALIERVRPALTLADQSLQGHLDASISLDRLGQLDRLDRVDPNEARVEVPADRGNQVSGSAKPQVILFSSGTTGTPKAVMLTRENFSESARASGKNLGFESSQRWVACLPLFHVGGLAMVARSAWYGAALILHRGFDEARVNDSIEREGATHLSLVEATLRRLIEARRSSFPTHLKAILVGGGPVDSKWVDQARSMAAPVLLTYGLTEACSQVTTERLKDADGRSAGPPLDGIAARISSQGEIEVKGPTVMAGYFDDSSATQRAVNQGWLQTGDLGGLDQHGRLQIKARRSDLIISGGENIYPAEIERTLSDYPGVVEVAVGSLEDSRWGQVPVAVIAGLGKAGQAKPLTDWARGRMADFKVPKRWAFVDALPRDSLGKVNREKLKAIILEGGTA